MKVLLIGSGGREHALYWKLSQSPKLTDIKVFPGNAGFPKDSVVPAGQLNLADFESVVSYIHSENIELVVVGPEQPLVDGLADAIREKTKAGVFGPSKAAAQIEGSKDWAKAFMKKYSIPTARSWTVTSVAEGMTVLSGLNPPFVIKADGLAAGKGVTVTEDLEHARQALQDSLENEVFGESGSRVVIEEFLKGREASVFAICDGTTALAMQAARDHKRAFDGDEGPNTGGMGAVTPVEYIDNAIMQKIQSEVLDRALAGFQSEGCPYRGLLYAGLMIGDEGNVNVVEFNCRFGDPETQALLPLLDEDLLELCHTAAVGTFDRPALKFNDRTGIIVVLAAEGYPGSYKKGIDLSGLGEGDTAQSVTVFHAGTKKEASKIVSSGGRIAGIVATGSDLPDCQKKAYDYLNGRKSTLPGTFYRSDIGRIT